MYILCYRPFSLLCSALSILIIASDYSLIEVDNLSTLVTLDYVWQGFDG